MAKECMKCGAMLPDNSLFCGKCGADVSRIQKNDGSGISVTPNYPTMGASTMNGGADANIDFIKKFILLGSSILIMFVVIALLAFAPITSISRKYREIAGSSEMNYSSYDLIDASFQTTKKFMKDQKMLREELEEYDMDIPILGTFWGYVIFGVIVLFCLISVISAIAFLISIIKRATQKNDSDIVGWGRAFFFFTAVFSLLHIILLSLMNDVVTFIVSVTGLITGSDEKVPHESWMSFSFVFYLIIFLIIIGLVLLTQYNRVVQSKKSKETGEWLSGYYNH